MAHEQLQFRGLRALEYDELVPFDFAIDATNCYLDYGGIVGRNGYRNALASGAVGSGAVQGLARFRTSPSFARTIVMQGGNVYAVSDPTSETAQDGSVQAGIVAFGSTANISYAQVGQYLYMASDESAVVWKRARKSGSAISLDTLTPLAKGVAPTPSIAPPALLKYASLAAPSLSTSVSATLVGSPADVFQLSRGGSAHCTSGDTATWDFGTDQNWASFGWLQLFASPPTASDGSGHIKVAIATAAGNFEDVWEFYDTPGDNAPSCMWIPLTSLSSTTRAAARRIRFQVSSGEGLFYVFGHVAIPASSSTGEQKYFFTFYNSTTQQESAATDTVSVQVGNGAAQIGGLTFHNLYARHNTFTDGGQVSIDPAKIGVNQNFNKGAGLSYPGTNDYAGIVSFSGTIPTADLYSAADTVRGWKLTSNADYRLFKPLTYGAGATTYVLRDDGGDALSGQIYRPQGNPPPCTFMFSYRGSRIVCGGDPLHPNRLTISSYVPINTDAENTTSDPFVQFPPIPQALSDGWSFDVAPTAAEQLLWGCEGDTAYIATNERMCSIRDLDAPIDGSVPPFYILFNRGVIGRRAGGWFEGALFWAAHDGIYISRGRTQVEEFTKDNRRKYLNWLLPDSTLVVGYQDRKIYFTRGNREMRYDFVSDTWTTHVYANSFCQAVSWRDPSGTIQNLWMLDTSGKLLRRQASATSDDGTAIPNWTYSTGYDFRNIRQFTPGSNQGFGIVTQKLHFVFLDTTGNVTVGVYKDATTGRTISRTFTAGEMEFPGPADFKGYKLRLTFTGANGATLRRAMWDREPIDTARGGGSAA